MMKKGQIYEGRVNRVDFPNKGIVELDSRRAVVKNCIEGQKISFSVNRIRSGKSEGTLLEVLEKSPLEVRDQACSVFGICGGCNYHTMTYESQLQMKKDQVKRLLDQVCRDFEFEGIVGSPVEWGYRNKMEFAFGDEFKGGPLTLGLHKRGSFHDVLTTDDCAIVDEDFNKTLDCILRYYTDLGYGYFHKYTHKGYLRHLLVRKAVKTGEILIDLITTSQEGADKIVGKSSEGLSGGLTEESSGKSPEGFVPSREESEYPYQEDRTLSHIIGSLLELNLKGKITGILHSYNDSPADVVLSDRTDLLYGRDYISEELLGLKFKITAFSFFQTNSLGAEALYSKVREYAGDTKDKNIFDLYSGTGTIAQLLAPVAGKVIGVEIIEEAVKAARENATLNGLTNCEFIAGDVLNVIDELKDKPDIIVLDPPRDGIHPKALDKIIDFKVDKIIYVSCKPTTLIRDLVVLQARGYNVVKVSAVDMFPQTVHCEIIVKMCRNKQK